MVRNLPRICRGCKHQLKSDFNRHQNKHCTNKFRTKGWILLDKTGREVLERDLPRRVTRVLDGQKGVKLGSQGKNLLHPDS